MKIKNSRDKFTEWFCDNYSWMINPPVKDYVNNVDNISLAIVHIYNGSDKNLNGKKCLILGEEKENGKYNYFSKNVEDNHLFRPIRLKLKIVAETLFDLCAEKLGITLNQNFGEAYIDTLSTECSEIIFAVNIVGVKRKWWHDMNKNRVSNDRLENKYFTVENISHIPIEDIISERVETSDLVKGTYKIVSLLNLSNCGSHISSFKKFIL